MKSRELKHCTDVLESVLDGSQGIPKTVKLSKDQHSALQELLKIVSTLSRGADDKDPLIGSNSNLLSLEQRKYLNNFSDTMLSKDASHRRGQKLVGRQALGPDLTKARLKVCVRKVRIANTIGKNDAGTHRTHLHQEMSHLDKWDTFNVNTVAKLSNRQPLQAVGYASFDKYGLIQKFSIPPEVMYSFLATVEEHYLPNPYHNSTHAADVTQTLIALLEADQISAQFTDLEILAMIVSTIIHDVGHPGWNNAFLINTQDEQAIVYNDASVNENMSVCLGFKILQYSECNILANLSREDYFYVRKLVIDIVLATDMAFHSSCVEKFRSTIATEDPDDWDSWLPASRALAMQMLVHCADLGNPCKPPSLAGMWTKAVYDEFFRQGDAEREAGLPVSALFDRNSVSIHASQATFLDFVVLPCYRALAMIAPTAAKAGLGWVQHNRELWKVIAASQLQHGIIGFDTDNVECEIVHVSPRPLSHARKSQAWGNIEMLTSLLMDPRNSCVPSSGPLRRSQRGQSSLRSGTSSPRLSTFHDRVSPARNQYHDRTRAASHTSSPLHHATNSNQHLFRDIGNSAHQSLDSDTSKLMENIVSGGSGGTTESRDAEGPETHDGRGDAGTASPLTLADILDMLSIDDANTSHRGVSTMPLNRDATGQSTIFGDANSSSSPRRNKVATRVNFCDLEALEPACSMLGCEAGREDPFPRDWVHRFDDRSPVPSIMTQLGNVSREESVHTPSQRGLLDDTMQLPPSEELSRRHHQIDHFPSSDTDQS